MNQTFNDVLKSVTNDYLLSLDYNNLPDSKTIELELLNSTNARINEHNEYSDKNDKWRVLKTLQAPQIAEIITKINFACRIAMCGLNGDPDNDIVAVYQYQGYNKGIYLTSNDEIRQIIRQYNYTVSKREFDEIMLTLRDVAPRKEKTMDKDLIAVNNGIFNYKTKKLNPFRPNYIFLSKSHVDYVDNAVNPIINDPDGTKWDVESWMNDLSDDPEIVQSLWEITGAIIRPNVSWNKAAWLYSEEGNNGKGTIVSLMRSICGEGAYASIPIKQFNKDFMLEPLLRTSAVLVDENDVGSFIDGAADLKAVITNDTISINRKHKTPVIFKFRGFVVQCLNEFPKAKDKSGSWYRRQLFIPMNKSFKGIEKTYIKSDFLKRKEVLEYVLYKVLHNMNYYKLSEPAVCAEVLEQYKEANDPIRQFYNDIKNELVWDLVPFTFLHDLYRKWFVRNVPSGKPIGKITFIKDLNFILQNDTLFRVSDTQVRTADKLDKPEPLILEYDVKEWMNKSYHGNDTAKICKPSDIKTKYRGLERI